MCNLITDIHSAENQRARLKNTIQRNFKAENTTIKSDHIFFEGYSERFEAGCRIWIRKTSIDIWLSINSEAHFFDVNSEEVIAGINEGFVHQELSIQLRDVLCDLELKLLNTGWSVCESGWKNSPDGILEVCISQNLTAPTDEQIVDAIRWALIEDDPRE